jgi:Clp amino terminal domain, pathogenicity island component
VFERLDPDARAILSEAIAEAKRLGNGYLGTEHVLIALASSPTALPDAVREQLSLSAAVVREQFGREVGTGVGLASDETLLATLGIDLGEIRRRAEATFGPAALDRVAVRSRRRWGRARRRCFPVLIDSLGVMPRVKRALEQAGARQRGLVSPTGLLLAILEDDDAMASRLLIGLGHDLEALRAALAAAVES